MFHVCFRCRTVAFWHSSGWRQTRTQNPYSKCSAWIQMNCGSNQITKYLLYFISVNYIVKIMVETHGLTHGTVVVTLDQESPLNLLLSISLASFPVWRATENMGTSLIHVLAILVKGSYHGLDGSWLSIGYNGPITFRTYLFYISVTWCDLVSNKQWASHIL